MKIEGAVLLILNGIFTGNQLACPEGLREALENEAHVVPT